MTDLWGGDAYVGLRILVHGNFGYLGLTPRTVSATGARGSPVFHAQSRQTIRRSGRDCRAPRWSGAFRALP